MALVLLELAVVTVAGSVLGEVARRLRQPTVVGEIVAGILLGPTLLGRLPGHLTGWLFPVQDRPLLQVLANLGLALFMCTIGFGLDRQSLRQIGSPAMVALGSAALPFAMGSALGAFLYSSTGSVVVAGHRPGELAFVLFFGVTNSITAFPVLARILADLGQHQSRLGRFVMASAAGADLLAWTVLAFVTTVATSGSMAHVASLLAQLSGFVLVLAFVVRPLLRWVLTAGPLARSKGRLPLVITFVGLLLSAWTTTRLGFQPIFGSFLFGAVMASAGVHEAAPDVPVLIEQAGQLLIPVFFVITGLSVNLSDLGTEGYLLALLIIGVACGGKFLGATGAARASGLDLRQASAVGVLMNSRGLTELVVIQTGLVLGVLSERLAAMLVIMAVVTTVATTPLFLVLHDERSWTRADDAPVEASAS
jgi:Kef-type K+ transport system membrane component KefB